MKPAVSVLMSVYNGRKYLREAVDSVLCQTFSDFEFLIVDDASTDESLDILNSYNDPRISVFPNSKNLGLTASLNFLFRQARGEFLARLDCDDIAMPDRLLKQVETMQQEKELILLAANCTFINEESVAVNAGTLFSGLKCDLDDAFIRWLFLFIENPVIHSSVLLRAEPLRKFALFYDERLHYAQDVEFWRRLASYGKMKVLDEALIQLRIVADSITSRKKIHQVSIAMESARSEQSKLLNLQLSQYLDNDPLHLVKLYKSFCRRDLTDKEILPIKMDLCRRLVKCLYLRLPGDPEVISLFLKSIRALQNISYMDIGYAFFELVSKKCRYLLGEKRRYS